MPISSLRDDSCGYESGLGLLVIEDPHNSVKVKGWAGSDDVSFCGRKGVIILFSGQRLGNYIKLFSAISGPRSPLTAMGRLSGASAVVWSA